MANRLDQIQGIRFLLLVIPVPLRAVSAWRPDSVTRLESALLDAGLGLNCQRQQDILRVLRVVREA